MARSKKDNIAEQVAALRADGIEFVRFELPDLHAISRSKLVPIDAVEGYARKGLNFYGGILALDTASNVISGAGLNDEISYADSKLFPTSPPCAGCPGSRTRPKSSATSPSRTTRPTNPRPAMCCAS